MLNTFDNMDKSETRRRDRLRQIQLMAEATNGGTLPAFMDENEESVRLTENTSKRRLSISEGSNNTSSCSLFSTIGGGGDGGDEGGDGGVRSPTADALIAEGLHAPPLGMAESAKAFIWEDDDDEVKDVVVPSRGFEGGELEEAKTEATSYIRNLNSGGGGFGGGNNNEAAASSGKKWRRTFRLPIFGGHHDGIKEDNKQFNLAPHRDADDGDVDGHTGPTPPPRAFLFRSGGAGGTCVTKGGGGMSDVNLAVSDGTFPGTGAAAVLYGNNNYGMESHKNSSNGIVCSKNRAISNRIIIFVFVLGVSLLIVLGASHGADDNNNNTSAGGAGSSAVTLAPTDDEEARLERVVKRIVRSGVSSSEDVPYVECGDSPQCRAAKWLAHDDPMQLDTEDEFFLQRYGLAVLWFATTPGALEEKRTGSDAPGVDPKEDDSSNSVTSVGTERSVTPDLLHEGEDTATSSGYWERRDGWMTEKGICAWHGVRCHSRSTKGGAGAVSGKLGLLTSTFDANGHVSQIVLEENKMNGRLPKEVFTALTQLTLLDLNDNALTGELHDNLGHLQRLDTLDLGRNRLHGHLPSVMPPALANLDLGDNKLSGPLDSLLQLAETLSECSLFNNELTGTIFSPPAGIVTTGGGAGGDNTNNNFFRRLESLYLDSNELTGRIPADFFNKQLDKLLDLRLGDNNLTGKVPSALGELESLEVLYLNSNRFSGTLPGALANLWHLQELHLYDNALTGSLSSGWSTMRSLQHLYLDGNRLNSTIPLGWGGTKSSLKDLSQLYLNNNELTGAVPAELGELVSMTRLSFAGNRLHGVLPGSFGNMVKLEALAVQENDLSGRVPDSVCSLRKERELGELRADCGGASPGIVCECCTECF